MCPLTRLFQRVLTLIPIPKVRSALDSKVLHAFPRKACRKGAWHVLSLGLFFYSAQILGATSVSPSSLRLAWDPNPESDVASYQLSYGTAPGQHSILVEAGLNTAVAVTGLLQGTTYYFVVSASNQAGLRSAASTEISYQIPVTSTAPPANLVPQAGWSLKSVDSQELNGFAATNAFDGNPNTIWSTGYLDPATVPPHEIQIDLGAVYPLSGFRYLPRQDAYVEGNIATWELYVGLDGTQWGTAVATGSFVGTKAEKEVLFGATSGRYVKLRILTAINGDTNCAVAELNFLQTLTPVTAPTFATWAAAANLTEANAGPLATPQQDGIPNLLKYAFGMAAASPDVTVLVPGTGSTGLPCITLDQSGDPVMLRLEYLRRKNSLLTYIPRKSLDLQTWQALGTTTPLSVTDVDAEWERVVFAEPCDPATTVCFGRVEVMLPN